MWGISIEAFLTPGLVSKVNTPDLKTFKKTLCSHSTLFMQQGRRHLKIGIATVLKAVYSRLKFRDGFEEFLPLPLGKAGRAVVYLFAAHPCPNQREAHG